MGNVIRAFRTTAGFGSATTAAGSRHRGASLLSLLLACWAHAGLHLPIATGASIALYNTGAGLAGGSVDPHYSLISSADPRYPGPNAYATTTLPGSYLPNNSTSSWIG